MQATINGIRMNYEVTGTESAPPIVLHHPLATSLSIWDELTAALVPRYRVVRFDARGHGKTEATKGAYSFETLTADTIGLMDHLRIERAHFLGLSMGGMVGQWLGANAPHRVERLILSNTNFHYADKGPWNDRIKFVREKGLAALVDPNMERWFTAGFRARAPQAIARMKEMFLATDPAGYIASSEAVRDMDFTASNPRIGAPTLVIVGKQDPATPPSAGEAIVRQIKGAKLAALDAAHISNIEQPQLYTETVLNFLRG